METMIESTSASRNCAELLRAICEKGNAACAKHLKKNESTLSRVKSDQAKLTLTEFSQLCAFTGIRINHIANDKITVDAFEYKALITLGQFVMGNLPHQSQPVQVPEHLYNSMLYLSSKQLLHMRAA